MDNLLNRLSRLTPLTGVVFAVLGAVAFLIAPGAPGETADGAHVIAFYAANHTAAQASDFVWMLAFAFMVFFAGSLRNYLRRTAAAVALSSVVLAGGAMLAVGATVYFGFDYALAAVPSHLAPAAAQALNVLAVDVFLPVAAGGLVFGIASGLAILRGAGLPKWLGWVAIVVGLATLTGLPGIVAYFLWTAIVSVLIWRRSGSQSQTPRVGAPGEVAAAGE